MIIRPPYNRGGECKRRGNCCHYILFKKYRWRLLDRLYLFWCREINGFFLREKKAQVYDDSLWYVMGCRYLKKNGSCGHYHLRPSLCRTWPKIEIFGRHEMLKGCGFKAIPRKKHPLNIIE